MDRNVSIDELNIKLRTYIFLKKNELLTVAAVCEKLDEGIEKLLKMPQSTHKVSIDLLKAVIPFGYSSEKLVEEYFAVLKNDPDTPAATLALWKECHEYF
ncbi:MAG: hypothetical protein E7420_02865 [Ruminococcaceae bacterium]|nr:hypothetical protein [Oscillospiraceae bacterium]